MGGSSHPANGSPSWAAGQDTGWGIRQEKSRPLALSVCWQLFLELELHTETHSFTLCVLSYNAAVLQYVRQTTATTKKQLLLSIMGVPLLYLIGANTSCLKLLGQQTSSWCTDKGLDSSPAHTHCGNSHHLTVLCWCCQPAPVMSTAHEGKRAQQCFFPAVSW